MRTKTGPWKILLLLSLLPLPIRAAERTALYRLEKGSTLLDDCPICGRIPIVLPLEGTFLLNLDGIGDVTDWYRVEDIDLRTADGREYLVGGSGSYLTRLGEGGIVRSQSMSLEAEIDGEIGIKLESGEAKTVVDFPAIDIQLEEETSSQKRIFKIHIVAVPAEATAYEILPGSVFVDDCLDCGRRIIPHPLTGEFLLSKLDENPLFATHRLHGIELWSAEADLAITGWGTYSFGGEVALLQEMDLDAAVSLGGSVRSPVIFSSGGKVGMMDRRFPEIEIGLEERDPPDPLHIFKVHLVARPKALPSPIFRRGDSNDDGGLDISDAVRVLSWLFAGSGEPDCLDAADADGSDGIDLTDAVFLLTYLFLSGGEPPDPGPGACGPAGKPSLGCRSYGACE